jgi:hypothetical protein
MKRLVLAGAAALLWVVGAQAADFDQAGAPIGGGGYAGPPTILEGGLWGSAVSQTDDDINHGFLGLYTSFATGVAIAPNWLLGFDLQAEARNSNTYNQAPSTVWLSGAHLQYLANGGMIGAFAGFGAPNMGASVGFRGGYVVGAEGALSFDNFLLFGQVGYGHIITWPDDEGFVGAFGRVGALINFGPGSALQVDAGYGRTPYIFEDTGDGGGTYVSWGVKYVMQLPQSDNLFVTFGYEGARYTANTEDSGTEHSLRVGLAMPFGAPATAAQIANPLATPISPFRAAAWGGTLD